MRTPFAHRVRALVFALIIGCSAGLSAPPGADSSGEAPIDCAMRALSLRVEPSESETSAGPRQGARVQFRAIATFGDGRTVPVPAAWTWDRLDMGSVDAAGRFETSGGSGGDLRVRARALGAEGTARLRVQQIDRIGAAPSDLAAFEDARPREATASPSWIAPDDKARFAVDTPPPDFRWTRAGHDRFRLRVRSSSADVSFFTSEDHWTPDGEVWRSLATSHRGRNAGVVLEAIDANRDVVYPATRVLEIGFCQPEICNGLDDDCDGRADNDCEETWAPFVADASLCPGDRS